MTHNPVHKHQTLLSPTPDFSDSDTCHVVSVTDTECLNIGLLVLVTFY